jgi:hypothetical protein
VPADTRIRFQFPVRHARADLQDSIVERQLMKPLNFLHIDQHFGLQQAMAQKQQQLSAAGVNFRPAAEFDQSLRSFGNRGRLNKRE